MKKCTVILWFAVFGIGILPGFGRVLQAADESPSLLTLSAGYGIPFGHIGLNVEVNPLLPENLHHFNNYLSFDLGIGVKRQGLLLSMGGNVYPLGRAGRFVPRFSFHYAKVDRILDEWSGLDEEYDTIEALCLGGGLSVRLGDRLAVRADLFYLFHIYDDVDAEEIGGRFKLAVGLQYNFSTAAASRPDSGLSEHDPAFLQVGLGLGIPYGGIGVNLEFSPHLPGSVGQSLHRYGSLLIGSGFTGAGSAYSIGLRIYPFGKDRRYRPRIGFHYGTVAVLEWWGGDSSNLEGAALSAGLLWKISQCWAIDADLLYIAKVSGWDQDDLDSLLKMSVGIRILL